MAIFNSYVKLPEGSHLLSGMIQVVGMAIPPRTGPVAVLVVHQAFLTAGRHSRPVQLPQQPGTKRSWDGMRLLKGWVT